MSTASISHIEYDPASATFQEDAKQVVAAGRANGGKFATYVPVDGKGEAVTVILHDKGSDDAKGAEALEAHNRKHPETGSSHLNDGPRKGISKIKTRTATVTHHGESSGAKPFALVFAVSYDAAQADALKGASQALAASNPSLCYHVVRRKDTPGHALVVVPVDALDELDRPAGESTQSVVETLKGAVTNVHLVKMKRLAEYSG
jgi:hypothetical protein